MVDVPPVIRIFAQGPPELDLPRLLGAARTHFSADLEVLKAHGYSGDFEVRLRRVSTEDQRAAEHAELAGKAAGMAGLARRCANVWEVRASESAPAWFEDPALLNLCAILASVALGPVLPVDLSTLFGVRGAMERVERALGKRSLER
jgi:hypothetical protein